MPEDKDPVTDPVQRMERTMLVTIYNNFTPEAKKIVGADLTLSDQVILRSAQAYERRWGPADGAHVVILSGG